MFFFYLVHFQVKTNSLVAEDGFFLALADGDILLLLLFLFLLGLGMFGTYLCAVVVSVSTNATLPSYIPGLL